MTVPMFRLRFLFEGQVVIDREVAAVESRLSDVSPAWPAFVRAFREIVGRAFTSEGASTGKPWKALAPSTQGDRRRAGFGAAHPILRRTNELYNSIMGGGGGFVETTPTTIALGSNDPIFWYHQSARPRKRLPRRPMVLLRGPDRTALARPVLNWVVGRDPNAARRAPAS
jgi:hypothetical protein